MRIAGAALIALGLFGVVAAGWVYFDAWATRQVWETSAEAQVLARRLAEPTPIWLPAATPGPGRTAIQPLPIGNRGGPTVMAPVPAVSVSAKELSLDAVDFRFLDPPEPGAHARLAATISNHGAGTSNRILLGVPAAWFKEYAVIGTGPAVTEDRLEQDGTRTFSFPGLIAGATVTFELHVVATAEETRAPSVKVVLASGDPIAETEKPATKAPTPRPGPVMALDIPRLKLKSGVVQTAWEPPPFAIGQIKGTAHITMGNTVLIGHLSGAAGNVFAHLDELQPGDEVTAVSRGLPYSFVVSRTFGSTNVDKTPMEPGDDTRLTLMTCAGIWNPITHDYSERYWVIAEPPEQAQVTIANAAAEATAVAATTATARALEPTSTPVPPPFKGEPSLPGGLGNSRVNLEKSIGYATGETDGKLVVFRPQGQGREVRVAFSPDPPRATMLALMFAKAMPLDEAVAESRKLFPHDTRPRAAAPEGNPAFVVERFSSPTLALSIGFADFSVIYTRDEKGAISSLILGLGEDFDALIQRSRR